MLKRFGIVSLLLSASAVLLPTTAFGQNFRREAKSSYSREYRDRQTTEYRDEDRDRNWRDREWRERVAVQTYYVPAPNGHYAPAPHCNR